jgi:hypothetical protein
VPAAFNSPLIVEDDTGFPFTLKEPLSYTSPLLHATLLIPIGFKTDFASIPQILWNILPPVGAYDKAAVVHDFLYAHERITQKRKLADQILREAMEALHVIEWKRKAIYWGVRIGGWWVWHKYRKG